MPSKNTTPPPKANNPINQIITDFPDLDFKPASRFSWHARGRAISYVDSPDERTAWALLHEIGHAELNHEHFSSDIDLLQKEVAAWAKAREISEKYKLSIDQDYVEDHLDTYRDWLHLRSTCPTCFERCLQTDKHTYECHNCGEVWKVTGSRLCRPYRRKS